MQNPRNVNLPEIYIISGSVPAVYIMFLGGLYSSLCAHDASVL